MTTKAELERELDTLQRRWGWYQNLYEQRPFTWKEGNDYIALCARLKRVKEELAAPVAQGVMFDV